MIKQRLGNLIHPITDYHANGSYKVLKKNVTLKDTEDYALMIRTTNFEQDDFKTGNKFIDKHAYEYLKKSKVLPGDIIMNKIANAGSVYLMPDLGRPVSLAMNLFLIRPDSKKVNPAYIYLFLKQNEKYVKSFAQGSVTLTITKDAVRNLEILVPDRDTQDEIVNIFEIFDSKIETNKKINENLEKTAKILFKSWFIDFDPVRAKAEGRSIGLSKEISDLFPNSFEDSELGEIPKGWQITNLDALTSKFTTGLNPRKNFVLGSGENFYVTIKNLGDFDVVLDEKCDKVDNDAIKKINSRSDLKKDDILFSGIGTIGKVAYVFSEPKNWNISESVFSLRANLEITHPSFLYQLLKSYPLQGYVDVLASGSVQRGIRMGSLKEYKFSLSNFEVQKKFNEIISPLIEKISINLKETRNLIFIRDILLPKLISGELRIPDAEKLVEEIGI